MLLSIDKNKIETELKNSPQQYVASAAYLEPEPAKYVEIPSSEAHSAVNVLPPDVEAARERVMALRKLIVSKGVALVSGEALERVIDETRGRS